MMKKIGVLFFLGMVPSLWADIGDQVANLEQQINYFQGLNIQDRLEVTQSNLSKLQGRIDELSHTLVQINDKLARIESMKKVASAPQPVVKSLSASDEYKKALGHLKKKNYTQAKEQFKGFIDKYPSSKLTVNAHYWLGEIYLLYSHYNDASNHFKWIIDHHPKHDKAPDAMFKWGVAKMDSGHAHKASDIFRTLILNYPKSTSAHLAKVHMRKVSEKKS